MASPEWGGKNIVGVVRKQHFLHKLGRSWRCGTSSVRLTDDGNWIYALIVSLNGGKTDQVWNDGPSVADHQLISLYIIVLSICSSVRTIPLVLNLCLFAPPTPHCPPNKLAELIAQSVSVTRADHRKQPQVEVCMSERRRWTSNILQLLMFEKVSKTKRTKGKPQWAPTPVFSRVFVKNHPGGFLAGGRGARSPSRRGEV